MSCMKVLHHFEIEPLLIETRFTQARTQEDSLPVSLSLEREREDKRRAESTTNQFTIDLDEREKRDPARGCARSRPR